VTPAGIQARFAATDGTDPIFRPVDGATAPTDDCTTVAGRQQAYAMLLTKGLFRIQLSPPAGAEFTVVAVDDPYHYATPTALSLFRRPLPATNLAPDPAIMWDLREPSLVSQATDATLGHEQAGSADPSTMSALTAFETTLSTAQLEDRGAGWLDGGGARGGPVALAAQPFSLGINDPSGGDYDADVFTEYAPWGVASSIARGETIFNTRTFAVAGVPGVADNAAATCSYCHDTPGVGSHSLAAPTSLGLDDFGNRTPDMPLYTLQRTSDGTTVQTTDPGYAMTSGKWADIGKFKVPVLRGLEMRAPYFHNGLGSSLANVVTFYDQEFTIGLSTQDQADLVAFLQAL
jgi:cytochrome c peroxidase